MSDSSGREIITLQVGRYANFVGTHFWNFQDELVLLASRGGVVDAPYDHSVLHRPAEGRGTGGPGGGSGRGGVPTPRLVAFDTRDALGSLNPLGLVGGGAGAGSAATTAEVAQSTWAGGVSVFQQPSLEKNALHEYLDNEDAAAGNTAAAAAARRGARGAGEAGFGGEWGRAGRAVSNEHEEEDDDDDDMGEATVTGEMTRLTKHPFGLDDTVDTWPDFLKSRLHPRALQELPFRDESSDFGLYTSGGGGRNGALDESDRERNSDALRRQLEECDAAQGTQTLVDLEGGWAGLGTALAGEIEEECRNRPRVCYAFLRRRDAPTGPGCHLPGAMGGDVVTGTGGGGAGAARSAVNLALGLHGLCEAFSLSFVLDEEACNAETSPYMDVDPRNAYHTSAVLGAALDVATSPLRFSSTGLDAWAGGNSSGSGGGVPMVGGGGAFAGGGRGPPPDAGMTLATLSAWLPLPHPDASMETLTRLLSPSIPRGGDARDRSGLFSSAGSASTMVSLGPVLTRRGRLSRIGRGQLATAVAAAARVYSRKTVLRGFTASRGQQMDALEQLLNRSGVGSGCSYSVCTPLPIPITYPLLFRESLGLRGELLSTPLLPPPPPSTPQISSTSGGGHRGGARGGGAATSAAAGEMRVMCDQISGVVCAERDSDMGSFIGQVVARLDMRRGGVLLELEKNDMHKDDAAEIVETLTGMAESYGYSGEEGEEDRVFLASACVIETSSSSCRHNSSNACLRNSQCEVANETQRL
ncbi:unnamed protein product [Pylaiella littoralis]